MGNSARKYARQFTFASNSQEKSASDILVSAGKCECVYFFAISNPNRDGNLLCVGILRHSMGQPPNVRFNRGVAQQRRGFFKRGGPLRTDLFLPLRGIPSWIHVCDLPMSDSSDVTI